MPKCLKPVYYLQADPKWGSKTYKSPDQSHQTIAGAGCGITCAAMVIATLCPKTKTTPAETAKWSMDHNYKASSGTKWEYFVPQMKKFDIPCKLYQKSDSANKKVIEALRTGENFVIASMAPGNWTSRGHYILAYYMDKEYVYINDPASTKSHRTKNKISLFTSQAKGYWIISHKGQTKNYTGSAWDYSDVGGGSSSDDSSDSDEDVKGFHIRITDDTTNGQGNSNLAGYINRIDDQNSESRTVPVSAITIHSAMSTGSLEKLASMIKSSKTTYNYGIDNDGVIGLFVDEAYASNSTGNDVNDDRSVNIVCMNKNASKKTISNECKESLIDLCEDICRRRYITQLVYNKKKPKQGTLTLHSQFQSSSGCPGSYIEGLLPEIMKTVNTRLDMENMQRVTVTSWQAESNTYALRAQSTVELGSVSPYVARLGHDTLGVNYKALQKLGVVGIMFHGGAYYDTDHKKRDSFVDIHLAQQMEEFAKSKVKMPYAMDYYARARTVEEAKLECERFFYVLAKYKPKLGAWITCQFKGVTSAVASDIVDIYYENFVQWGFKSKCGIIASKDQAKLIGWPKQAAYMPLWLEGEMDESIAPKEEVLTPSYFKLDDLKNKGYNEDDDAQTVQDAAEKLKKQFGGSSNSSDSSTSSGGGYLNMSNVKAPAVGKKKTVPNPIDSGPHKGQNRTGIVYEFGSVSACVNYPGISKSGWPYKAATSKKLLVDKNNGIGYMNIDGTKRWGTAFTTTFGGDGACVDLYMSDGTTIPFVVLDCKRTNNEAEHSDAWGHDYGKQVTELFLSTKKLAGYQYLGSKSGAYPIAFKIVGYIKITDL